MCMRFRRKFVIENLWYWHTTCHFVLPFSVVVGRWSHHANLTQAKRDLNKEKIRSPNDAWKGYLKTWDWLYSKSFQGQCPWSPQGGDLQGTIWTPNCKGQRADVHWVMAYGHKTQSFLKNGGQQKCLDKAPHRYILQIKESLLIMDDAVFSIWCIQLHAHMPAHVPLV